MLFVSLLLFCVHLFGLGCSHFGRSHCHLFIYCFVCDIMVVRGEWHLRHEEHPTPPLRPARPFIVGSKQRWTHTGKKIHLKAFEQMLCKVKTKTYPICIVCTVSHTRHQLQFKHVRKIFISDRGNYMWHKMETIFSFIHFLLFFFFFYFDVFFFFFSENKFIYSKHIEMSIQVIAMLIRIYSLKW